jgi:hypothetical protein
MKKKWLTPRGRHTRHPFRRVFIPWDIADAIPARITVLYTHTHTHTHYYIYIVHRSRFAMSQIYAVVVFVFHLHRPKVLHCNYIYLYKYYVFIGEIEPADEFAFDVSVDLLTAPHTMIVIPFSFWSFSNKHIASWAPQGGGLHFYFSAFLKIKTKFKNLR